jgi:hypothetical protein
MPEPRIKRDPKVMMGKPVVAEAVKDAKSEAAE